MPLSYPLIPPASPLTSEIKIGPNNVVGENDSPFTGKQQIFEQPGEWFEGEIALPPMSRANAEPWLAFLTALRGKSGTFYLGDPLATAPLGSAPASAGAVLVNGTVQGPKVISLKNFAASALVLKAGDWFNFGIGLNATRIQTSGGTGTDKFFFNGATSVNGQVYVASVRVQNRGPATIAVRSIAASVAVATGQESQVVYSFVGDGVTPIQMIFRANAISDSMAFAAWAPRLQRQGIDENLITATDFTSPWAGNLGATVGLSQNYNQRLYKVLSDVTSDSSGNAQAEIFPRWRSGDLTIDGDWVNTASPKGIFRLADNLRLWEIGNDLLYKGVTLKVKEAF
jgi:hypothetical protein